MKGILGLCTLIALSGCTNKQTKITEREPQQVVGEVENQVTMPAGKSLQFKSDVDYNSLNFKNCMSIYAKSLSSDHAADVCEQHMRNEFIFRKNRQFESCYLIYYKSLSSSGAADTCVEYLNAGINIFLNESYKTCVKMKYKSLSSSQASDSCIMSSGFASQLDKLNKAKTNAELAEKAKAEASAVAKQKTIKEENERKQKQIDSQRIEYLKNPSLLGRPLPSSFRSSVFELPMGSRILVKRDVYLSADIGSRDIYIDLSKGQIASEEQAIRSPLGFCRMSFIFSEENVMKAGSYLKIFDRSDDELISVNLHGSSLKTVDGHLRCINTSPPTNLSAHDFNNIENGTVFDIRVP